MEQMTLGGENGGHLDRLESLKAGLSNTEAGAVRQKILCPTL